MAQQHMNRTVSAQESTISQEDSPEGESSSVQVEDRFECPICINWLNDPVLTSCGHRFCKKCITSWLMKSNSSCPIDNKLLTYKDDVFPDNYTRREISQIRKPCPNAQFGCQAIISPIDLESHLIICEYKKDLNINKFDCIFNTYGCKFVGTSKESLDTHINSELSHHLNLLMTAFNQMKMYDTDRNAMEAQNNEWDAPEKNNKSNDMKSNISNNLIKGMYERIVFLEQTNLEQNLKIDNLQQQLIKLNQLNNFDSRYSQGTILWRITNFNSKLEMMSTNSNRRLYSNDSYTSPYGYKFCARINISPKTKDSISLYIHLMQSENDFHLDWPFRGRMKIILIHPHDMTKSRQDTIMSNPKILAFHRPEQEISPRGFGFLEYIKIEEVFMNGFIANDTLTIKIQLNLV